MYSDKNALPFFNSDNCHGDNFYYPNEDRMRQAIKFWLSSYSSKWFVRWTIIDKEKHEAIGTIETITPRWESTNVVVPSISISGKQISVSVYISPKKSTTSSVGTLYLEKKVGNGWTPVTSWSIDGTGSVSITKTYTGTMGITYRTRVVVTTGVDKIDATSTERTV